MNITWDAKGYQDQFQFVPQYGESVLSLLDAPEGSFVVDLGCGNGALTRKLAEKGYRVLGIDASSEMLAAARADNPGLPFCEGDAVTFSLQRPADAIFSNAVFHWIDREKQDAMIANLARQLKPGGELVFEFGGKGCAEKVHAALEKIFKEHGLVYPRVFYFPTIGEYAPLLEKHGLRVTDAFLFDRPTPQQGENGLADWIRMFDKKPFEGLSPALAEEIIQKAVRLLAPSLLIDGRWIVDYVRLRMRAVKES